MTPPEGLSSEHNANEIRPQQNLFLDLDSVKLSTQDHYCQLDDLIDPNPFASPAESPQKPEISKQDQLRSKVKGLSYDTTPLWAIFFVTWLSPLISLGKRFNLIFEDIPLPPASNTTSYTFPMWSFFWTRAISKEQKQWQENALEHKKKHNTPLSPTITNQLDSYEDYIAVTNELYQDNQHDIQHHQQKHPALIAASQPTKSLLNESKPWTFKELCFAFVHPLILSAIGEILFHGFSLTQPFCIKKLSLYFNEYRQGINHSLSTGIIWALALGFISMMTAFMTILKNHAQIHLSTRQCSALLVSIYAKTLRIAGYSLSSDQNQSDDKVNPSNVNLHKNSNNEPLTWFQKFSQHFTRTNKLDQNGQPSRLSTGMLTNLVSNDTMQSYNAAIFIHFIWSGPVVIAITLILMYGDLGSASFVTVLLMLLLIPYQFLMASIVRHYKEKVMALTDDRIKYISQLLNGIRVIKLYAWEKILSAKLNEFRTKELSMLRLLAFWSWLAEIITFVYPLLTTYITLWAYIKINGNFNTETVFLILAYLNTIRHPIQFLSTAIQAVIDFHVSSSRIAYFLGKEELPIPQYMAENVLLSQIGIAIGKNGEIIYNETSDVQQTQFNITKNSNAHPLKQTHVFKGKIDTVYDQFHDREIIFDVTDDEKLTKDSKTAVLDPAIELISITSGPTGHLVVQTSPLLPSPLMKINHIDFYFSSFTQQPLQTPVLSNISFDLFPGQLVATIGYGAKGKSAFLLGILGELYPQLHKTYNGLHSIPNDPSKLIPSIYSFNNQIPIVPSIMIDKGGNKIGYCAQSPWLINDTFRNNILLNKEFNQERYLQCIIASALDVDLKIFPDGDLSIISDGGLSLSGGQLSRVAFCRLLYHAEDVDIVILDDIFAAVDSYVAKTMFFKGVMNILCFQGGKRKKLGILMTLNSQYDFLQYCTDIIIIDSPEPWMTSADIHQCTNLSSVKESFAKKYKLIDNITHTNSYTNMPITTSQLPYYSLFDSHWLELHKHLTSTIAQMDHFEQPRQPESEQTLSNSLSLRLTDDNINDMGTMGHKTSGFRPPSTIIFRGNLEKFLQYDHPLASTIVFSSNAEWDAYLFHSLARQILNESNHSVNNSFLHDHNSSSSNNLSTQQVLLSQAFPNVNFPEDAIYHDDIKSMHYLENSVKIGQENAHLQALQQVKLEQAVDADQGSKNQVLNTNAQKDSTSVAISTENDNCAKGTTSDTKSDTNKAPSQSNLSNSLYLWYLRGSRGVFGLWFVFTLLLLFSIASQALRTWTDLWIVKWAQDSSASTLNPHPLSYWLSTTFYGMIGSFLFFLAQIIIFIYCQIDASTYLHDISAKTILHSVVGWLDTTPMGTILNYMTKDIDVLDNTLPDNLLYVAQQVFMLLGILFISVVTSPFFLIPLVPIFALLWYIRQGFHLTSVQLKRIESSSLQPIYSLYNATLKGAVTIRAHSLQDHFLTKFSGLVDNYIRVKFVSTQLERRFGFYLNSIAAGYVALISVLIVLFRDHIDTNLGMLAITYSLRLIGSLQATLRYHTLVSSSMTSIHRLYNLNMYTPQEGAFYTSEDTKFDQIASVQPKEWKEYESYLIQTYPYLEKYLGSNRAINLEKNGAVVKFEHSDYVDDKNPQNNFNDEDFRESSSWINQKMKSTGNSNHQLSNTITSVDLQNIHNKNQTTTNTVNHTSKDTVTTTPSQSLLTRVSNQLDHHFWPWTGKIVFDNISIRYRPELPLVINNLSFSILPGQHVGICGRSGSAKSTLFASLMRLLLPESGSILIDGIDVSQLGLGDLRSRISVIPQLPTLFQGTLRYNLDPTDQYTDKELLFALEFVQMRSKLIQLGASCQKPSKNSHDSAHDSALDEIAGLYSMVNESGNNFSASERQLLCVTRALLSQPALSSAGSTTLPEPNTSIYPQCKNRFPQISNDDIEKTMDDVPVGQFSNQSREFQQLRNNGNDAPKWELLSPIKPVQGGILLADEITSTIDPSSDELVQKTLRTVFENSTMLIIAHRLISVVDLDRILVLKPLTHDQDDSLVEYDHPFVLLSNPNSSFFQMCLATGAEQFIQLYFKAQDAFYHTVEKEVKKYGKSLIHYPELSLIQRIRSKDFDLLLSPDLPLSDFADLRMTKQQSTTSPNAESILRNKTILPQPIYFTFMSIIGKMAIPQLKSHTGTGTAEDGMTSNDSTNLNLQVPSQSCLHPYDSELELLSPDSLTQSRFFSSSQPTQEGRFMSFEPTTSSFSPSYQLDNKDPLLPTPSTRINIETDIPLMKSNSINSVTQLSHKDSEIDE